MLFGGYPCFFSFSSLTLACQRPTTKAQVKASASNASSRLKRSESFKCVSSRLKPRDFNAPNKDSMPQRFLYCSCVLSQYSAMTTIHHQFLSCREICFIQVYGFFSRFKNMKEGSDICSCSANQETIH